MRSMKTFFTEPTLFADEVPSDALISLSIKSWRRLAQYRIGGYVREDSGNSEENLATHISKSGYGKPKCYSLCRGDETRIHEKL